jgi:hypothetical protein
MYMGMYVCINTVAVLNINVCKCICDTYIYIYILPFTVQSEGCTAGHATGMFVMMMMFTLKNYNEGGIKSNPTQANNLRGWEIIDIYIVEFYYI